MFLFLLPRRRSVAKLTPFSHQINRAVRELDREKAALEREEKRLTMEIKKAAKAQQMSSVKIMAKVRATGMAIRGCC